MYLLYPDSYNRYNNYRRPPNNYVYWHIVPLLSLFQPGAHSWCNKYYRRPPIRYIHREKMTHSSVAGATTIIDVYPSSKLETTTIWTRSLSISVLWIDRDINKIYIFNYMFMFIIYLYLWKLLVLYVMLLNHYYHRQCSSVEWNYLPVDWHIVP